MLNEERTMKTIPLESTHLHRLGEIATAKGISTTKLLQLLVADYVWKSEGLPLSDLSTSDSLY